MNDATKEIKVGRSFQEPVSRSVGVGHPIRSGVPSPDGAAHLDLPGHFPVGIDSRTARRQRIGQAEHVRAADHEHAGSGISLGLGRPRWHRLIERWPNTIGWACTGGFVTVFIAVIQAIH